MATSGRVSRRLDQIWNRGVSHALQPNLLYLFHYQISVLPSGLKTCLVPAVALVIVLCQVHLFCVAIVVHAISRHVDN